MQPRIFSYFVLLSVSFFLVGNTANAQFSGGDGSQSNPYQIATLEDLQYLSENSSLWNGGYYFIQTADIDASETSSWNSGAGFTPIGNGDIKFKGYYNGQGHTIDGLYINIEGSSTRYVGLFGYLYEGLIENLGVKNGSVSSAATSNIYFSTGSIVGYNDEGTIRNCYNNSSVFSSSRLYLSDCGGIVGTNYGTISNCYNTGDISALYGSVCGGIIGGNLGNISNCYNMGDISASSSLSDDLMCGGVVGYNLDYSISNCYNTGNISSSSDADSYSGGIVGYLQSGSTNNCYYNEIITLSGDFICEEGTALSTAEMKQAENFSGWDFSNTWGILPGKTYPALLEVNNAPFAFADTLLGLFADLLDNDYDYETGQTNLVLKAVNIYSHTYGTTYNTTSDAQLNDKLSVYYRVGELLSKGDTLWGTYANADLTIGLKGSGTSNDPFQISTLSDLQCLSEYSSLWNGGYYFIQTADIDASETSSWNSGAGFTPIGNDNIRFNGYYNGQGHTINGLYINIEGSSTKYVGLFGYLETGLIENLGVKSGSVSSTTATLSHSFRTGSIVGYNNEGTIHNCYNTSSVFSSSAFSYCGGIVGESESGTISNCYNTGDISASYRSNCGGIVGDNSGNISNCYNTGNVFTYSPYAYPLKCGGVAGNNLNGSISSCYNTGNVSSSSDNGSYSGGIVGYLQSGTTSNCYNNEIISLSGDFICDEGTALSTAEMKQAENFSGWDFSNTWGILPGKTYPALFEVNNAPVAFADSFTISASINLDTLLANDYDYETGKDALVFKIISKTDYSFVSSNILTFNDNAIDGNTDTIVYRIGELLTTGDTLWGNQTTAVFRLEELGGSGSVSDPYQISTLADLEKLSLKSAYWEYCFIQTANIDASKTKNWNDGKGFLPIGFEDTVFAGSYNGQGYSINNLYINRPSTTYVGLFGYVKNGDIKNLGIFNCEITGRGRIGGLVGEAEQSTVSNCYCSGTLSGSSEIGGLAGFAYSGSISGCYSTGTMTGSSTSVGGLVGSTSGSVTISNCYSTALVSGANYVGGLTGANWGTQVDSCYCAGKVLQTGSGGYVGGFVGYNKISTITECYFNSETSGQSSGIGYDYYGTQTVTGLTTAQMKQAGSFSNWDFSTVWGIVTESTYPALLAVNNAPFAFADSITTIQTSINLDTLLINDYDYETGQTALTYKIISYTTDNSSGSDRIYTFNSDYRVTLVYCAGEITAKGDTLWGNLATTVLVKTPEGSGTINDPYRIAMLADLQFLSENSSTWGSYFIQTADIDASDTKNWNNSEGFSPIGNSTTNFSGYYDGQGYIISNLFIDRTASDIGLFGILSSEANLLNIGVVNGTISGGNYRVGGLVGANNGGTIKQCFFSGTVTGAYRTVGGLAGFSSGQIEESYTTGSVSGSGRMGGFVGNLGDNAVIKDCYSTSNVNGLAENIGGFIGRCLDVDATITNCYSSGTVSGTTNVGGFMGDNNSATLTSCYFDKLTSGTTTGIASGSGTVQGMATSEMKIAASFTGWGINEPDSAWVINNELTYPALNSVNNAPFAFADSIFTNMSSISLDTLLANDYDYETGTGALTYKLVSATNNYSSISNNILTFPDFGVDTIVYRVGEKLSIADTLWGNSAKSIIIKKGPCEASERCTYTMALSDSYGDGWNGAAIALYQGGVLINEYTLTDGSETTITVDLCSGYDVELVWLSGGYFDYECSFEMFSPNSQSLVSFSNGDVYDDGDTVFTFTADCSSCNFPESLSVSDIGNTSANLSWAESGTATEWQIEWGESGFEQGMGTIINTNSTPYSLTGLTALTRYDFYVRSVCNEGGTSSCTGPCTFLTDGCEASEQCTYTMALSDSRGDGWNGAAIALYQGGILINEYTLTDGSETTITVDLCSGYDVELVWLSGSNDYRCSFEMFSPNSQSLVSFNHGSIYKDGDTIFTFTTDCSPYFFPESLTATNITNTTADLSWTEIGTATKWQIEWGESGFEQGMGTIINTNSTPYSLTGLTALTRYDFYVRSVCNEGGTSSWTGPCAFSTDGCEASEQCMYTMALSSSYGDGWRGAAIALYQGGVLINEYTLTGGSETTITVDLCSGYDTELVWLSGSYDVGCSFEMFSPYSQSLFSFSKGDVYDDGDTIFTFTTDCFSCNFPESLSVSNIGNTSANLSWTEIGTATEWQIEWGESGFEQGMGTIINTNSNPYSLTGLTALTRYDFYVRSVCNEGGASSWIGPCTFLTDGCEASEQCAYTMALSNSYDDGWNGAAIALYQGGVLINEYTLTNGYGTTITVDLCSGYDVELVWLSGSNDSECSFEMFSPNSQSLFSFSKGNVYDDGDTVFTFTTDCFSCSFPESLTATNITNTTADISWTEIGTATEWQIEWGESGFEQGMGTIINTNSTPYSLTGLTALTRYDFYVRSVCNEGGTSSWAGPCTFVTDDCEASEQCTYTMALSSLSSYGWHGAAIALYQGGILRNEYTLTGGSETTIPVDLCSGYDTELVWLSGGLYDYKCSFEMFSPYSQSLFSFSKGNVYDDGDTIFTFTTDCFSCNFPESLSVSNIGTTAADLSWTESGTATEWQIEWGESGFEQGMGTIINTNSTPYSLTGLTALTRYDFYVRSVCNEGGTSYWTGPCAFSTRDCEASEQCTYTMALSNSYSYGWHGAAIALYQGGVLINEYTLTDGSETAITVDLCHGYDTELVWLSGSNDYRCSFEMFSPNSQSLFSFNRGHVYDDGDTVFTFTADCFSCNFPESLSVSDIGNTSANLSWAEIGTATEWQIEWGESGFEQGMGTIINTNSNPYSLTGLTALTRYDFYVRSICNEGGASSWTGPCTFVTRDCEASEQCTYTMDLSDSYGDGWNGAAIALYQGGVLIKEYTLTDGSETTITVDLCSGYDVELVWLSGFNDSECSFEIFSPNSQSLFSFNRGHVYDDGDTVFTFTADCPFCFFPESLTATNITNTTADLSWTEIGTATEWQIEWGESGFVQGMGTYINITLDSLSLTGLTALTRYDFYVRSVCNEGNTSSWSGPCTFSTSSVNSAPTLANETATTAENTAIIIDVLGNDNDPDGDSIYISNIIDHGVGSVSISIDSIVYTPATNWSGLDTVVLSICDTVSAAQECANDTVFITVTPATVVNDAPVITSTASTTATEDVQYIYTVLANDPEDGTLTYSISGAPSGMTITDSIITWTPGEGVLTSGEVTLIVSDGELGDTARFTITVTPVNDAPVITSTAPTTATEDVQYIYTVLANDPEDSTLTYSINGAPSGMTITDSIITWIPGEGVLTSGEVTLIVSDGELGDTARFTITVTSVNDAPVITSTAPTTATEDVQYIYTVLANDPEDSTLTYSISGAPSGMTITDSIITWTPGEGVLTSGEVTLIVSDGELGDTARLTITVTPVNDAPVITSTAPTTATEDVQYIYTVLANDPEDSTLTYSISGAPSGMTITDSIITWTPGEGVLTSGEVTLIVSDGELGDTARFTITVTPVNDAPVITSTAPTVATVGVEYSYIVTVSDPENDNLSYSLNGEPSGMGINDNVITWTPQKGETTSGKVTLTVSDGNLNDTEQFTISVAKNSTVFKILATMDNSVVINPDSIDYTFFLKDDDKYTEVIFDCTSSGDTTIVKVEEGDWMIRGTSVSSVFLTTYVGDVVKWEDATITTIAEGKEIFITLNCQSQTDSVGDYTVSGYVYKDTVVFMSENYIVKSSKSDSKEPMMGVTVLLYSDLSSLPIKTVQTNSNGYYEFTGLCEGDYYIEVDIMGFTQLEDYSISLYEGNPSASMYFTANVSNNTITDTENLNKYTKLDVYPNPSHGEVTIDCNGALNNLQINVYSITGQKVYQEAYNSTDPVTINLDNLVNGIYVIRICTEDSMLYASKKIVLIKE